MKILITVPDLTQPGGVASLYNILEFDREKNVSYFPVHGSKKRKLGRAAQLLFIYLRFCFKCRNVNVVHLNPSLNKKSFVRDGMFAFLGKIMGKKVLVYWHGWSEDYCKRINNDRILKSFFNLTFKKADLHLVLGSRIKEQLKFTGITGQQINLESNAASNYYISNDTLLLKELNSKPTINILFISRVETEKGIYIAIETLKELGEKYNITLTVCGNGTELENIRKKIFAEQIDNIRLLGHVEKNKKHEALREADFLILPSFSEGMPITILEGMLYGLPIISSDVGGIPDWVADEMNGYLISTFDAKDYAKSISRLIDNPEQYKKMSRSNRERAIAEFTPEVIKQRLKSYYGTITQ